jgi:hypothetical protein
MRERGIIMAEISTGTETKTASAPAVSSPRGRKTLAWIFIVVTAVTVMYWTTWFVIPGGRDALAVLPNDHTYITFENTFPVADGWMALCALLASIQFFRGKASAIPWTFMGSSAGMYLGAMDISYDIQNGIYTLLQQNFGSVVTEMIINIATVTISVGSMIWAWKNRGWRGAAD